MRIALFLFHFVAMSLALFAQDVPPVRTYQPRSGTTDPVAIPTPGTTRPGSISLQEGPGIERTMERFSDVKHVQQGFRVQIFLGDRRSAEETKRTFLQLNPDTPAYLSWLAPNFRLRVGDLRTRLEAEHLLRELKTTYPGSYIVSDEIEMQRIPQAPVGY
ncbi:MAG: SPOR domain-containing protein [Flavobacteriales bacterium]|nr:SPOR domain-containing protein [Flavobacteriales bacterium]